MERTVTDFTHQSSQSRSALKHLLQLPGYPDSEVDAADILQVVHSRREEAEHRKYAAEKAVHRCTIQLSIFERKMDEQGVSQSVGELESCRRELSCATEAVAGAEEDIGVVRVLLRKRGFSTYFHNEGGVPLPHLPTYRDDAGEDSGSDNDCSDSDLEG
jgi:hypothetical protein